MASREVSQEGRQPPFEAVTLSPREATLLIAALVEQLARGAASFPGVSPTVNVLDRGHLVATIGFAIDHKR